MPTLLLGALVFLAPFSIDVSLPGLPLIARTLAAPSGAMQWTLSAYVLANGIGQFFWGPVSDRYGRRPVIIVGLSLFTLAASACAFTTDVRVLIALRLVQGLGSCAGFVCAFAIVTDLRLPAEVTARRQAAISAINNIAPLAAPVAGVAIVMTLGWRPLYGIPAILAAGVLFAIVTTLPETSPRTPGAALERYRRVFALPRVPALAAMIFTLFAGYFAMISGSPFALVSQLHLSTGVFAIAFAVNAASALLGSFVTGRLAGRWTPERIVVTALATACAAGIANAVLGIVAPSAIGFASSFALYAFGFGLIAPATFAIVLPAAAADAGVASGILGAAISLGGAAGSALAGTLPFAPTASIGSVVGVAVCAAALCYRVSRTARR